MWQQLSQILASLVAVQLITSRHCWWSHFESKGVELELYGLGPYNSRTSPFKMHVLVSYLHTAIVEPKLFRINKYVLKFSKK